MNAAERLASLKKDRDRLCPPVAPGVLDDLNRQIAQVEAELYANRGGHGQKTFDLEVKLNKLLARRSPLLPRVIPEALVPLDQQIASLEQDLAEDAERERLLQGIALGTIPRKTLVDFDARQREKATDTEIESRRKAAEAARRPIIEAEARRKAAAELGPQLVKGARRVAEARAQLERALADAAPIVADVKARIGLMNPVGDLLYRDLSPEAGAALGVIIQAQQQEDARPIRIPSMHEVINGSTNVAQAAPKKS